MHRLFASLVAGAKAPANEVEPLGDKLDMIAEHSSIRERAAADAERATVELKKCGIYGRPYR